MNRRDYVLACMSTAKGSTFTPAQVQKMFFLIDKGLTGTFKTPYFNFIPYHYGPFDKEVYSELERLSEENLADIDYSNSRRCYRLTVKGQSEGEKHFSDFPKKARDYIEHVSDFVRSISFVQLVKAIYQAYPEMRENSVFQEK